MMEPYPVGTPSWFPIAHQTLHHKVLSPAHKTPVPLFHLIHLPYLSARQFSPNGTNSLPQMPRTSQPSVFAHSPPSTWNALTFSVPAKKIPPILKELGEEKLRSRGQYGNQIPEGKDSVPFCLNHPCTSWSPHASCYLTTGRDNPWNPYKFWNQKNQL